LTAHRSSADALAAARSLADEGNVLAAVDALQCTNGGADDGDIERRLVRLRSDAFAQLDRSTPSGSWPPPVPGVAADIDGLPTVAPGELTLEALRSGIFGRGCLLVPGLVPAPQVDRLVAGIDRAFEGYEAQAGGAPISDTTPWFEPFSPGRGYSAGLKRKWGWEAGGVFLADSPRVMRDLIEALTDVGLGGLIAEHFGERPALSMYKSILRRVPAGLEQSDWHQDGAFLGEGIRVVNVWLCLSHCGRDAPGLDVVARRFDRLVESGTGGAHFKWSVGPRMVAERYGGSCVRPTFEPGDVLLFDELFLHRTATEPEMTKDRYAIETWFFAPSAYPEDRSQVGIPLVF
jgi:Phytanoyl-CoA dioxygenase (PhyH)